MTQPALEFHKLSVSYGKNPVLRSLSLTIPAGACVGLVGESGCGKSTAAYAALRALPPAGRITAGTITIDGERVTALPAAELRRLRATRVSMVYQDPSRALNPTLTIGAQLTEVFDLLGATGPEAIDRAKTMLGRVRFPSPARIMAAYPHQLSGGMQQRVVIAMALAKNPALLILDEPTTGLDATVEAEILDLVDKLRQDTRTAVLLISHNLPMVGRMCDRIGVLYAGTLVEEGPASEVLRAARHPYTASLIHCMPASGRRKQDGALATISGQLPSPGQATEACVFAPRCARAEPICRATAPPANRAGTHLAYCHFAPPFPIEAPEAASPHIQAAPGETPLLSVRNLTKTYPTPSGIVRAVTDISFTMHDGEILGLVGESGSGKTTLAKLLLGLVAPDPGGSIALHGAPLAPLLKTRPRRHRQALQIIFQNPDSALNRAHRIRHILSRPLSRLSRLAGPALETRLQSLAAAGPLGRPEAARRHRPRLRRRAQDRHLRRAHLGAGRLHPGRHPEPARRPAAREKCRLYLHLSRPRGHPLPRGPNRGALSRPHPGNRPGRGGLLRPAPPLYCRPALRRPLPARRQPGPYPPHRRNPQPRRDPPRLRLPEPLPTEDRPNLRNDRARIAIR